MLTELLPYSSFSLCNIYIKIFYREKKFIFCWLNKFYWVLFILTGSLRIFSQHSLPLTPVIFFFPLIFSLLVLLTKITLKIFLLFQRTSIRFKILFYSYFSSGYGPGGAPQVSLHFADRRTFWSPVNVRDPGPGRWRERSILHPQPFSPAFGFLTSFH